MNDGSDTIAAISTAPGEAGISIVRVSGPKSLEIADRIFRGNQDFPPSKWLANSFARGFVRAPDAGSDIDEVILLLYRAPHSYTRENVVEIQGHGGRVSAQRILRAVLSAGARLAEPGEFTRRAFLSGRIDLVQAEAVADLIRARSDRAAKAAVEQLEGSLSIWCAECYNDTISTAADFEATLDFGDGELPDSVIPDLKKKLKGIAERMKTQLETWEEGHLLREGAVVVISGRPNVGKSTLMNCLLGKYRAIVTDIPGTTRDTIEEQIILEGIPIRLVDTAGLRNAECRIEKEGIRLAEASILKADLVLYMVDCSQDPHDDDRGRLAVQDPESCVVVLNKSDMGCKSTPSDFPGFVCMSTSLTRGEGIKELKAAMVSKLGIKPTTEAHAVISERHRDLLRLAVAETDKALKELEPGRDEAVVLAAANVRAAAEYIGLIIGKSYSEDLLDNVFRRFCVGK